MKNDVDNLFNKYFFVICMPAETCLFRSLTVFILLFVCTCCMWTYVLWLLNLLRKGSLNCWSILLALVLFIVSAFLLIIICSNIVRGVILVESLYILCVPSLWSASKDHIKKLIFLCYLGLCKCRVGYLCQEKIA